MDLTILSANLRRIRNARGKSQGDVADAAGLSRLGYRNIESGAAAPRVDSLLRVAKALDVRLEDLLVEVRELTRVRFRAEKKMTTRSMLLADVARWLDAYNELEELLDHRVDYAFQSVAAELARDLEGEARAKKAAEIARQAIGIGQEPIRDICGLLEDHGVKVFTPTVASEGFFGLSVAEGDGGPAVVVNVWERLSVERWIFTAAHELGHLLLHFDAYNVEATEEDGTQEKEADTFASYFLMPEALFNKEMREAIGLPLVKLVFKLKRIFRVGWKSVLYRLSQQHDTSGHLWGRFQAEYRRQTGRTLGKTDEPNRLPPEQFRSVRPAAKASDEPEHLAAPDFIEDRLWRLVRRARKEDLITTSRAAEILGVDIATMRRTANSWLEID